MGKAGAMQGDTGKVEVTEVVWERLRVMATIYMRSLAMGGLIDIINNKSSLRKLAIDKV